MIKDQILRIFFIPFLGIGIPYVSGLVTYRDAFSPHILTYNLYFIFMSWSIWTCAAWLHKKIRVLFSVNQSVFAKIFTVIFTNTLFGGAIATIMTLVWFRVSGTEPNVKPLLLSIALSILAVIVFTLVYEILYLSREREFDSARVFQLDRAKTLAEISDLKNELEPHFIFNSLNTLSHLILFDPQTAHTFNMKLASILKYFLINKNKETISLEDELEFMDDYMYLLQLRFDNKIELHKHPDLIMGRDLLIIPFAIQISVENAIKHNEYTEKYPLKISMLIEDGHLLVKNKCKPKPDKNNSTGTGLRNLGMRYRLFCNKDILIYNSFTDFVVSIPLLKKK